jgi:hypothetical protein
LIVRAFPLRSSVQDLKDFASALSNEKKAETAAFYRRYGIVHESWHLQETPEGRWVIGVTAIDDKEEAAPRYAESSAEFDRWFKNRVMDVSGINPDTQPLGPLTTQVFGWADEGRPGSDLGARRADA